MIMKNLKRRRLNNKGFTLIELLAVVVILAVVMGIATTSVLTSMNKSRGGSLADSAMVIANGFNQKYTESLVGGVPSDVYSDVLGLGKGYNFQSTGIYYLDKGLAVTFNISEDGYAFANSATGTNGDFINGVVVNDALDKTDGKGIKTNDEIKNSVVYFDASTGKFIVCLFANRTGSYFVDNYKEPAPATGSSVAAIGLGSTGVKPAVGSMYACSDGKKSW